MVAAALRESMILYIDTKIKKRVNDNNEDEDNDNDNGNDYDNDVENVNVLDTDGDDDSNDLNDTSSNVTDGESADDEYNSVNILDDEEWRELIDASADVDRSGPPSELDTTDDETDVLENPGTTPLWNQTQGADPASATEEEGVQHSSSEF